MDAEQMAGRRAEPGTEWHARFLEAFQRSDYEAMVNYYRAYYPTHRGWSMRGPR